MRMFILGKKGNYKTTIIKSIFNLILLLSVMVHQYILLSSNEGNISYTFDTAKLGIQFGCFF